MTFITHTKDFSPYASHISVLTNINRVTAQIEATLQSLSVVSKKDEVVILYVVANSDLSFGRVLGTLWTRVDP